MIRGLLFVLLFVLSRAHLKDVLHHDEVRDCIESAVVRSGGQDHLVQVYNDFGNSTITVVSYRFDPLTEIDRLVLEGTTINIVFGPFFFVQTTMKIIEEKVVYRFHIYRVFDNGTIERRPILSAVIEGTDNTTGALTDDDIVIDAIQLISVVGISDDGTRLIIFNGRNYQTYYVDWSAIMINSSMKFRGWGQHLRFIPYYMEGEIETGTKSPSSIQTRMWRRMEGPDYYLVIAEGGISGSNISIYRCPYFGMSFLLGRYHIDHYITDITFSAAPEKRTRR